MDYYDKWDLDFYFQKNAKIFKKKENNFSISPEDKYTRNRANE